MEDVLWHSATFLASKSILVKMPRLPTIRVIGSQFISTRFFDLLGTSLVGAVIVLIRSLLWLLGLSSGPSVALSVRSGVVSGGEFSARMTPLRFFVDGVLGQGPQGANSASIGANSCTGNLCPGRLIHEGHELVGESRHGAADADAAHMGAAADSGHPAAFGHVAVHYRTPASQLHDALWGTVHFGEVALLVVPGTIAAFMNR